MDRKDFVTQLQNLGYQVEERGENRLAFRYRITVGIYRDQEIWLGLAVNDDWFLHPPGGPHVSPRLLPIHPARDVPHPRGGVHESPFGADWQYWSRPFPGWAGTERTASTYLGHIRNLFLTQ
jgi:hypothetical protein